MSRRIKISTVIPVYNSREYIERCIDSVISQSYSNWEMILVDDGSRDNSIEILNEYAKKDPRIKVLHQDNSGPGSARNKGIDVSTGEYIVFVDSDDVISPDYFEKLSSHTEDVVFIDVNQLDEDYKLIKKEYMSRYQKLNKDDFLRFQITGKIEWGGVRKAVRSELIKRYGIQFSNHKIGEEAIYSFLVLYYAESYSFIEGPVYNYFNRPNSQSSSLMDDPWGNVVINLRDKIKKMGVYDQYSSTLNAFMATSEVVALDRIAMGRDYKAFSLAVKQMHLDYLNRYDERVCIDYRHMGAKAKLVYPLVKHRAFLFFYLISRLKNMRKNNG